SLSTSFNYQTHVDLRNTFPQADPVRVRPGKFSHPEEKTTLTVFNIGRSVRLIAFINYKRQEVSIRHVLTHEEYDRGNWKR
ncbi:type II toxin-antitoxin system HigB family toxin, partial [Candidatus Poribacteria bacterium]|nr:type II toxin-antitoxin system HigB family toxin [Candidatus Poribacteria bacterium]